MTISWFSTWRIFTIAIYSLLEVFSPSSTFFLCLKQQWPEARYYISQKVQSNCRSCLFVDLTTPFIEAKVIQFRSLFLATLSHCLKSNFQRKKLGATCVGYSKYAMSSPCDYPPDVNSLSFLHSSNILSSPFKKNDAKEIQKNNSIVTSFLPFPTILGSHQISKFGGVPRSEILTLVFRCDYTSL